MTQTTIKALAISTLTASILMISQGVSAHSTLATRSVEEGNTIYNNLQVGHGCGDAPVIANSIVFPDGVDSTVTVTSADGTVSTGAYADYVAGDIVARHVVSNDAFEKNKPVIRRTPSSTGGEVAVGVHSWKGNVPAHNSIGLVPLRIGSLSIVEESCAKTVKLEAAVADICKITNIAGFADEVTVNFWTPFVEGSNFNRQDGENESATFTIIRAATALPESCGEGVDVTITPSAAQLNHDMPIPRVWPKK